MKKIVKNIILFLIALLMLFSFHIQSRANEQIVKAKVIVIYGTENVQENEETKTVQNVSVKILEGDYEVEEYDAKYYINSNNPYELKKGNNVYVKINQNEGEITDVTVEKVIRQNYIIYFLAILMAVYILVFRKNGLKIVLLTFLSLMVIYFLVINQISSGSNSLIISLIASIIVVLINTIVTNGINRKSLIIMLSSVIGVAISGVLVFSLAKIAMLSNNIQNSIDIELNSAVNYKNLILASGIIISIGVCLDIINSIVDKLKNINDKINFKQDIKMFYIDVLNKYNIIVFICLGIVLTYIITINNIANILNDEIISTIIVITIAILISITVLVPITVLIYIWLNKDTKIYKTKSDNIIDGQRTLKL